MPVGVLVTVWIDNDDELPEVSEAGLKAAVAPAGKPDTDSATFWAEPDTVAVLIVVATLEPWTTEPEVGFALNAKSLPGA